MKIEQLLVQYLYISKKVTLQGIGTFKLDPAVVIPAENDKDKDFVIVGVSLDRDKQQWKQAIAKDQLLWPQLIDPNAFDGEMAKYYGIESVPASYLLDKDGKIVSVGLTSEKIEAMIKNILD